MNKLIIIIFAIWVSVSNAGSKVLPFIILEGADETKTKNISVKQYLPESIDVVISVNGEWKLECHYKTNSFSLNEKSKKKEIMIEYALDHCPLAFDGLEGLKRGEIKLNESKGKYSLVSASFVTGREKFIWKTKKFEHKRIREQILKKK